MAESSALLTLDHDALAVETVVEPLAVVEATVRQPHASFPAAPPDPPLALVPGAVGPTLYAPALREGTGGDRARIQYQPSPILCSLSKYVKLAFKGLPLSSFRRLNDSYGGPLDFTFTPS